MRAPDFWGETPGIAAALLAPLGLAWASAARLRRAVARPYRAPVPVICVGNLVAGGSGKTPVVMSLAGILTGAGIATHAVTRGYGGRLAGPIRVDAARHDAAAVGDEPLLFADHIPCWVARDRPAGMRAAVFAGAQVILLDDGFQNPNIDKDLSLLVIDAAYGFGNGRVMPAGPLREPVGAGLRRADAVVLIGDRDTPGVWSSSARLILRAALEPLHPCRFAGSRVVAFAGIGRPAKFFETLRATGAELVATHPFPDHHRFRDAELAELRREAASADARLVTTAKDWVRLPEPARADIEVLEVALRWRDPAALLRLLSGVLDHVRNAPEADERAGTVGSAMTSLP